MGAYRKYTNAEVEAALRQTLGAITLAAEQLGASHNTVSRYVERSPKLQALISHYRERRVDKAELKLEQAISNGEPWAIALTLRTLGRNRGYVERQEVRLGQDAEAPFIFRHEAVTTTLATRSGRDYLPPSADQSIGDGQEIREIVHGRGVRDDGG